MSTAELLKPYVPEGFAEFWKETVAEAEAVPLHFDLAPQDDYRSPEHSIELLKFRGIKGQTLHGWVALPDQPSPGFLWIPPYSRWSMLPNEYGVRPGLASISLNFFGESAFHREDYTPARGYFADGVNDPHTWEFRRMFQDAVILARIFAELPGIDRERIFGFGMSQGGGIAIWLGAWFKMIRAVVADEPFLGGMPWVLTGSAHRFPLKELTDYAEQSPENDSAVRRTLSYFDTLNHATRCEVPTRLTLGLKDPAVRPQQVRAIYDALPGDKDLEEIDWGHDWHPRMIEGAQEFLTARNLI